MQKNIENSFQKRKEPAMKSTKISNGETQRFDRDGFYGLIYLPDDSGAGFGALEVHVDGVHLEKIVSVETRMYRVEEGRGVFNLDGESYPMNVGDVFFIKKGSTYSYSGKMKLFEINIPSKEGGTE